jgi:L-glutamine-phosphate cytidylyltransferase
VILAAGRGVRMGGGTPKTLLPLDERPPLLGYILEGLRTAGVSNILVVTGHRPDDIQSFIADNGEGLEVTYVRNARYASWGNFHSVRVALDQSPGDDVLVVNSDVVVPPDVYRRVADTPGDLVLAVQKRLVLDQEDMRVRLSGDRVLAIGKDLKRAHSHGEYAGVSLLRPEAARLYLELATNHEWSQRVDLYYEDVYGGMMDSCDVRAALVADDEYAEVDTPEDVADAVQVIERHYQSMAPRGSAAALT